MLCHLWTDAGTHGRGTEHLVHGGRSKWLHIAVTSRTVYINSYDPSTIYPGIVLYDSEIFAGISESPETNMFVQICACDSRTNSSTGGKGHGAAPAGIPSNSFLHKHRPSVPKVVFRHDPSPRFKPRLHLARCLELSHKWPTVGTPGFTWLQNLLKANHPWSNSTMLQEETKMRASINNTKCCLFLSLHGC